MQVLLFLVLLPIFGLACPNLDGSYKCGSGDETINMEISHKAIDGQYIYVFRSPDKDRKFTINNKEPEIYEVAENVETYVNSNCENGSFITHISGYRLNKLYQWLEVESMMTYQVHNQRLFIRGWYTIDVPNEGKVSHPINDSCSLL